MPNWKDLKRYCENNGWELYKDTNHYYYKKELNDGTVLFTKVSKGSKEISKNLFNKILKQLNTNKTDFNKKI